MRLADLGSAIKLRSPHDTATFMIGTPGYIAPEVLLDKCYSFGYDIWSMGALMHMLLSFRLPFYSKDSKKMPPPWGGMDQCALFGKLAI